MFCTCLQFLGRTSPIFHENHPLIALIMSPAADLKVVLKVKQNVNAHIFII